MKMKKHSSAIRDNAEKIKVTDNAWSNNKSQIRETDELAATNILSKTKISCVCVCF